MSSEELVETYLPDNKDIERFHALNVEDKVMVIRLGLALLQEGDRKTQMWKNAEWQTELDKVKKDAAYNLSEMKAKLEAKEVEFASYAEASQLRQKTLAEEVRQAERLRLDSEMSSLRATNAQQTSRVERLLGEMQKLSSDLDAKYNTRLIECRTFYEDKLSTLQEKYDGLVARGQNSTIKGKEGEEYVQGRLNMMFPQAEIEDTHTIPHRGDFILRQGEFVMMIETKNYTRNVQKAEVDKFYRDIDNPANSDIQCAVFVSLQTGICCKDDFSFEIRNMIPILFIHRLQDDFTNLILAVKFFKLITDQSGLDLSNKEILDGFKNMASSLRRNFNKQRSKLDKFHADQTALLAEQEVRVAELYQFVKQKY